MLLLFLFNRISIIFRISPTLGAKVVQCNTISRGSITGVPSKYKVHSIQQHPAAWSKLIPVAETGIPKQPLDLVSDAASCSF